MCFDAKTDETFSWPGLASGGCIHFASICDFVERQSVKLIALTGDSPSKAAFVEACLNVRPMARMRLGRALSTILRDIPTDELGMTTRKYLNRVGDTQPILLEDVEILFDPNMGVDVLAALKYASRSRLLCVDWPGTLSCGANELTYAPGDVPERRFHLDPEIVVIDESGEVAPKKFSTE